MTRYDRRYYTLEAVVLHVLLDHPSLNVTDKCKKIGVSRAQFYKAKKNVIEWGWYQNSTQNCEQNNEVSAQKLKPDGCLKNETLVSKNRHFIEKDATKCRKGTIYKRTYSNINILKDLMFYFPSEESGDSRDSMAEKFPEDFDSPASKENKNFCFRKNSKIIKPLGIVRGKKEADKFARHIVPVDEYDNAHYKNKERKRKGLITSEQNYRNFVEQFESHQDIEVFRPSYFFRYYIEHYSVAYNIGPSLIDELASLSGQNKNGRIRTLTTLVSDLGGFDQVREVMDFYLDTSNWTRLVQSGKLGPSFKSKYPRFGILLKGYYPVLKAFMAQQTKTEAPVAKSFEDQI